jgi:hypothetical protein
MLIAHRSTLCYLGLSMVQFLKDFGQLIGGGAALLATASLIVFHIVMKRRDEWKAIEIRVELAPRFSGDKGGMSDRIFVQIRNLTTRTVSVQAMVFKFGRKGEGKGYWDKGPDGRLLSPEDVERDKATNRCISVDDFVKTFGKRVGDTYKLPLREFQKTVVGFIQTAGTPALHRFDIPQVFFAKVKERMEADAYFEGKR